MKKFNQVMQDMKLLQDRFSKYELLHHFSADMMSLQTLDGKIQSLSPACYRLLGYQEEDLIGEYMISICHPHDRSSVQTLFTENEKQTSVQKVVHRVRRKEGDYIWLESIYQPVKSTELCPFEGFVCASRDITERIKRETMLQESEARYRFLVEQLQETIAICRDERWVYLNRAGLKLFGAVSKNEIIGKSIYHYIHADDRQYFQEQIHHFDHHDPTDDFEVKLVRDDGETRHVQMNWSTTSYEGKKAQQVIMRDVTQQKRTEEMLQQTEKLSVVGELAASIAHEIRNPITSVQGFAQLLASDVEKEDQHNYVEIMLSELKRVEGIVSDLLVLSKPQEHQMIETDVGALVEQTTQLFISEAIMNNVEIITDIQSDLPGVQCDPDQIKQVFVNILKNAVEAMTDEGRIFIKVQHYDSEYVLIRFVDEGKGIPQDRLANIGEPFYSTKEKGTGLGLMICKKIIDHHQGKLHISSEEDKGTSVDIFLPL